MVHFRKRNFTTIWSLLQDVSYCSETRLGEAEMGAEVSLVAQGFSLSTHEVVKNQKASPSHFRTKLWPILKRWRDFLLKMREYLGFFFFFFSFFPFSFRSTVGWAERLAQVLCFDVFVYFGHYHDTNSDAAAPAIVAPRSSSLFLGCRNLKCLRVREALENFSLSLQTDVNRLSELCDWRYQHTLMYSVTVLHAGLFQT